jgi:hypothetical protein
MTKWVVGEKRGRAGSGRKREGKRDPARIGCGLDRGRSAVLEVDETNAQAESKAGSGALDACEEARIVLGAGDVRGTIVGVDAEEDRGWLPATRDHDELALRVAQVAREPRPQLRERDRPRLRRPSSASHDRILRCGARRPVDDY